MTLLVSLPLLHVCAGCIFAYHHHAFHTARAYAYAASHTTPPVRILCCCRGAAARRYRSAAPSHACRTCLHLPCARWLTHTVRRAAVACQCVPSLSPPYRGAAAYWSCRMVYHVLICHIIYIIYYHICIHYNITTFSHYARALCDALRTLPPRLHYHTNFLALIMPLRPAGVPPAAFLRLERRTCCFPPPLPPLERVTPAPDCPRYYDVFTTPPGIPATRSFVTGDWTTSIMGGRRRWW